jgi:hypothetical protein
MNKLDVQENLTDFKKKLYAESLTIFEEEERNNIVKAMLFLAHKSTIEFFDEQMSNNMPDFIAVLVTMYPNLITTYGDVNSIPVDEDEETSIYDHILYSFYELMTNELIETGADIGVFERRENSIDLTPWYKL